MVSPSHVAGSGVATRGDTIGGSFENSNGWRSAFRCGKVGTDPDRGHHVGTGGVLSKESSWVSVPASSGGDWLNRAAEKSAAVWYPSTVDGEGWRR